MKLSLIVIALSLFASVDRALSAYQVVFEDTFDGTGLLNATDWGYEEGCSGWGNNELECYTTANTKNARREGGHLVIDVVVERTNNHDYTSARIHSKKHWTYGKFEIRAKMPKGKHLWPAIWMMPEDSKYGGWAASGEIDIMELRGERPDTILGTIHYGGAWPNNANSGSGEVKFSDFSTDFHTFGLEWERDEMRWYVDGKEFHKENLNRSFYSGKGTNPYNANRQPFDQDFHFILNVAVGGDFFNGVGTALSVDEAKQWAKHTMEIDFVRVSQNNANTNTNEDTGKTTGNGKCHNNNGDSRYDDWCVANCAQNYCPESVCICN